MSIQLSKSLVDLIYGTKQVRKKFELDHPTEKVLAADASKGIITSSNEDVTRGLNWITSQRAVILLTEDKIVCGKWTIPLNTIASAKLMKFSSLLGGIHVLKIQTVDNVNYQFGMQLNSEWTKQQRLSLIPEKGKVKQSTFSTLVRLFALGYLIYLLYERFSAN